MNHTEWAKRLLKPLRDMVGDAPLMEFVELALKVALHHSVEVRDKARGFEDEP